MCFIFLIFKGLERGNAIDEKGLFFLPQGNPFSHPSFLNQEEKVLWHGGFERECVAVSNLLPLYSWENRGSEVAEGITSKLVIKQGVLTLCRKQLI